NRLGELLAPMGVRYVVVPDKLAPGSADPDDGTPSVLVDVLGRQLDLAPVPLGEGVVVFENRAFAPVRAVLGEGPTLDDDGSVRGVEQLVDAAPALSGPLDDAGPG